MQGGQQVLRSDQKNMEEVQRVREAILKGESVFTNSQAEFIKHHATLLGEDGKAAMGKIQQKAVEPGCLLADIARAIEDYCKDLGHRAMLRELSSDLEKNREKERMAQLKIMEGEVGKLKIADERGDMAGLMQGKKALTAQLKEYLRGIEAEGWGGVASDTTGKWRRAAADLTRCHGAAQGGRKRCGLRGGRRTGPPQASNGQNSHPQRGLRPGGI
jgi:hypothetical protein